MWVDYRAKLIEKNPGLNNPDAKLLISSKEFLRMLQRAYHAGQESAAGTNSDPISHLFGSIFGGKV